ncbi:MAG: hypothetical protein ACRCYU_00385 [Nocardioides sp.]
MATQEAGRPLLHDWTAAPPGDLRFVADLARLLQSTVRFGWARERPAAEEAALVQLGSGTFEALGWLLGATDVTAATGEITTDRSRPGVKAQIKKAVEIRERLNRDSPDARYLQGVIDGLTFSLGIRSKFWWVPVDEGFRARRGPRDEFGRSI